MINLFEGILVPIQSMNDQLDAILWCRSIRYVFMF